MVIGWEVTIRLLALCPVLFKVYPSEMGQHCSLAPISFCALGTVKFNPWWASKCCILSICFIVTPLVCTFQLYKPCTTLFVPVYQGKQRSYQGNCSCHLIWTSIGNVPINVIKVELKHSHWLLHCGLYGIVHNFFILAICITLLLVCFQNCILDHWEFFQEIHSA